MEVAEDSSVWPAEHRLRLDVCMVLVFKYVSSVCGTVGDSEWSLWKTCLQIQVGEPHRLIQKH